MNKEKRMAYCTNNTQVGFHTGNGTTDNVIDFEVVDNINIINSCNVRKVRNRDWYKTYIRVNPNKNSSGYILEKYSDLKKVHRDTGIGLTTVKNSIVKLVKLGYITKVNRKKNNGSSTSNLYRLTDKVFE